MRLIDAEKLETTAVLGVQLQHADSRYYYFYEEETITNAPTVKAIPIEWIQNKYIERWKKAEMGRHDFQFVEVIDDLLEMWEKESESRDTEGIK